MRKRNAVRSIRLWLAVVLLATSLLPQARGYADPLPDPSFGQVVDMRKMELAPGAIYTWYDMSIDRGKEQMHMVEFDPKNTNLELKAGTKSGKVYGMQGVSAMANYADKPGNRVVAAINGDFYDLTGHATGVPNGLFMDEGRILASPTSTFAFGLTRDGVSVYGTPVLSKTMTINGAATSLTHINRYRQDNQLVLYTTDYSTSTKTTALGDEVILDIVEGEVKSGQTMKLKVAALRPNQGDAPLEQGKVVLSASGTARQALTGLQVGDEVSASFAFQAPWDEVQVAIGGQGPLIKDGVVQTNVGPEGVHPRTAIGTKADGSIVLFEIDGRAPGFSEGVETVELARILHDLGVVHAMNLDGGGSSTFVAKLPGETSRKMLNRGSDGGERQTGNGLLLVNKAPEGPAAKLVVQPGMERVLAGSTYSFKAAAVDAGGHPAVFNDTLVWQADPAVGSIAADGLFTAGSSPAEGKVRVYSGALEGTGEVEVVQTLTELKFPDQSRTFTTGETIRLSVTALRNGQTVQANNESLEWRVEGPIGTIAQDGTFHSADENNQSGKIYVRYGNVETSMDVQVGLPPVVLEDFEAGLGSYKAAGAAFNTVNIGEETNPDFVRTGSSSLKLSYDFTGKTGTSGAYLQATSEATWLKVPGYPEKIGMWVYGDGEGHWLRAQMRDGDKKAFAVDFTDQTSGVNWKGWKYIEAPVPKGKTLPLSFDMPVRYMETKNDRKTAGVLYIDQIRAVYGPLSEDQTPPVIKKLHPEPDSLVKTGIPEIRAYAEDAGYDPVAHPGTTLIDPDKIRLYVDGIQVHHGLYPPDGRISFTPDVPLDDGLHQIKLAVRDLSGNQTIQEWSFVVDTGLAKLKHTAPSQVYAGHAYTVDVTADKVAQLSGGQLTLRFDTAQVSGLSVVKGGKLDAAQLEQHIDAATGTVQVVLQNLDQTDGLTDSDVLARIHYLVKGEASGTNRIDFVSSTLHMKNSAEPKNYVGGPVRSEIKHELRLAWDEQYAEGMATTFTVTDENGAPVEGAGLLANGAEVGGNTLRTDVLGKLKTDALTGAISTYSLQAVRGEQFSPVETFKVSPLAGTPAPYNITMAMGADGAVSRGFNWHTHPDTEGTVVEVAKASGFTDFSQADVLRFQGNSYVFNTLDIGTIRVHKAAVDQLETGTEYVYRVGDGRDHYSPQGSFTTAPLTGDRTEFLVFGDSQAGDEAGFKIWGNTVKTALEDSPSAEFLVHVGDMVDNGFKEKEWNWWFEKAQQELMKLPAVTVVGNHEVTGTKGNGDFLAHFNHPQNGAESQKGSNYSFDYKNIHIAVLNSEYVVDSGQKEWLREDLQQTDKDWKMVFFHRGPYGSIYDTENVRREWASVFDEAGIDLVMNGHDHIYVRTYPMMNNQPASDGKGTTYIIPGSTGPKFYDLTPRPWQMVVDDENTQMYSSVQVDGDTLKVVTKTTGGRLVDTFELVKKDQLDDLASIEVTGSTVLEAGKEGQAVTEAVYTSGKRQILNQGVVYSSSVLHVATIDQAGVIRAVAGGETVISATYQNKSDDYTLTVREEKPPLPQLSEITLTGLVELKVGAADNTVTKAVYSDGGTRVLTEGVVYTSSNPDVATIDQAGVIRAVAAGKTVISATYQDKFATYNLTVWASDEGTDPDPDPIPAVPVPQPVNKPEVTEITEDMLKDGSGAQQVVIQLEGDLKEILLPVHTAELLGERNLLLQGENVSLSIPSSILQAVASQVSDAEQTGAAISLQAVGVEETEAAALRKAAGDKAGATLKAAGGTLEFSLALTTKNGVVYALKQFAEPLTLVLPVDPAADKELTGLYYVGTDSSLEYIKGRIKNGQLEAKLNHFSTYAVLEYNKTFSDVPNGHWASGTIRSLAAKQLAEGVDETRFAPEQSVTRAEFTALLVRLLGLGEVHNGGTAASFTDVKADDWYAKEVALAAGTGIVEGMEDSTFAPHARITRQEMAAMLIRVYEYKAGRNALAGTNTAQFRDIAGAPDWAQAAVEAAASLGLVAGRAEGEFAPEETGTRAEAAQLMRNLYEILAAEQ
jgi:large repetitive protein